MKKALITGISGFAGSHLAELLVSSDFDVWGLVHPKHVTANLQSVEKKLKLQECDLQDEPKVADFFKENSFDYIFHLAAFAPTAASFENPKETLQNNIVSQINILEALQKSKSKSKILIIGSADQYGDIQKEDIPVSESAQFRPTSPYAVSKISQDMLGFLYFHHYKLNIIRLRPSNHIGPRQSKAFVIPSFASQIAKLEKEGGGVIKVGNLNSWRDFTDVRDMVKAYLLSLEKCEIGKVYNVASQKLYKIEDILNMLISFSKVKIKIEIDPQIVRMQDEKKVMLDVSEFKKATNWNPEINIEKTLLDTLEYERSQMLNL